MGYYRGYESGHSRGGVDVTEAVNLAFKGILLSPIFILCIFITIAMLKHMIFGGIPTMNQPTEQQREVLQQRDEEINPREVWGGAPEQQTSEIPLTDPQFVQAKEEVPFVIYDSPQSSYTDLDKYIEPTGWNTQILEDPFE